MPRRKSKQLQQPQNSQRRSSGLGKETSSNGALISEQQQEQQEQSAKLLVNESSAKKWRNMGIRTFTTLLMITAFLFVLACGYIWSIVGVMAIAIVVYREVIQIAHGPAKDKNMRWFKTMSWYFLITTEYFLYGESIIYYFKEIVMVDAFLIPFATHHRFISFMLYVIGKLVSVSLFVVC
ncbi:hypothetical protein DFQ28_006233 [Apophysomyces sp. BC1034]|nr:hypothetical protein DFQ30_005448 [Apophysomyces sp. BC1015]KAG0177775.1 hypothetical protein DFQ29_004351 [Apophysomyces sp. BC1021]KAG0187541.1 hypothetical protein DFQ28_006233 [Apophysomyces sp. BC1034]